MASSNWLSESCAIPCRENMCRWEFRSSAPHSGPASPLDCRSVDSCWITPGCRGCSKSALPQCPPRWEHWRSFRSRPARRTAKWTGWVSAYCRPGWSRLLPVSQASSWGWSSPAVISLLVAAAVILTAWVLVERQAAEPLVDMTVFTRRPVLLTNFTTIILGFAMLAAMLLVAQFLETLSSVAYGFSASVTAAGLILMPMGAAMLVLGPVAGWLGLRLGYSALFGIGAFTAAAGFVWIAFAHSHEWDFVCAMTLLGIGYAFAFAAMSNLIVAAVDPAEVGIATGINTIARTVGGAFGFAVGVTILTSNTISGSAIPQSSAYSIAFLVAAATAVVAGAVILGLPRHSAESSGESGDAQQPTMKNGRKRLTPRLSEQSSPWGSGGPSWEVGRVGRRVPLGTGNNQVRSCRVRGDE